MAPARNRLDRPRSRHIAERDRELVGDAGCAEALEGIVRDDRMNDRAIRKPTAGLVMVCDHHLDPRRLSRRDLINRADPAVDRDHQPGPSAAELLDAASG